MTDDDDEPRPSTSQEFSSVVEKLKQLSNRNNTNRKRGTFDIDALWRKKFKNELPPTTTTNGHHVKLKPDDDDVDVEELTKRKKKTKDTIMSDESTQRAQTASVVARASSYETSPRDGDGARFSLLFIIAFWPHLVGWLPYTCRLPNNGRGFTTTATIHLLVQPPAHSASSLLPPAHTHTSAQLQPIMVLLDIPRNRRFINANEIDLSLDSEEDVDDEMETLQPSGTTTITVAPSTPRTSNQYEFPALEYPR
ncbi:unnamed protein product [Caenorhabditis bovis]|uniref:Uncharacterized protein n=1 Tax=Caenorhabditis bovis TaxID=2654633 RepID=A0A8S1EV91_9PELO|nr:unnamed protein product [Caenorhabditis bovis]